MKNYKTFGEKIEEIFQDLGLGKEFLDLKPRTLSIKGTVDKMDIIKKNFKSFIV